jgi:hypothetical protein
MKGIITNQKGISNKNQGEKTPRAWCFRATSFAFMEKRIERFRLNLEMEFPVISEVY